MACTMRMGVAGDEMGVAPAQSAVRLARAGTVPHLKPPDHFS